MRAIGMWSATLNQIPTRCGKEAPHSRSRTENRGTSARSSIWLMQAGRPNLAGFGRALSELTGLVSSRAKTPSWWEDKVGEEPGATLVSCGRAL